MALIPWYVFYLKTTTSRQDLVENLNSWLSKNEEYYGKIDNFDIELIRKTNNPKLPQFVYGKILGIDGELYTRILSKPMKHIRILILYSLVALVICFSGIYTLLEMKSSQQYQWLGLASILLALGLLMHIGMLIFNFTKTHETCKRYFTEITTSTIVNNTDVPTVFERAI